MPARFAEYFTICQTTFSVIPSPQIEPERFTHRNSLPPVMAAAWVHASRVALTQSGTGTVRMCRPLPIKSTTTQCSSRCWISRTWSLATSARRRPQPSSIAKTARSRLPFSVCSSGARNSRRHSIHGQPITQPNAELLGPFHSLDASGQFRTEQSTVGRLVGQAPHGGQAHVDGRRRQKSRLQLDPVAQDNVLAEGQARLGTVPSDEIVDRVRIGSGRIP